MEDNNLSRELLRREELYLQTPYVEPVGETETAIAAIWLKVLGLDTIGTQDDFFDIGGDSLAATLLASELEEVFRSKFNPSSIVENSTVSAQADFFRKLREGKAKALPSCITMFNAQGKKPPIFLLHGRRGFTLYHRSFLDDIDKDQPVAFLEAPGLDGRDAPLDRIETFAEIYLSALREVAPEGNWQIAANCAGSLIAHEMCVLAEQSGERVARLMLVDPLSASKVAKSLWRRKQWRKLMRRKFAAWCVALIAGKTKSVDVESPYNASDDDFAKRHSKYYEKAIRQRLEDAEGTIVPSRIAYNPEAMQKVCYQIDKACAAYVMRQEWKGQAFLLAGQARSDEMDSWKEYLPDILFRVVDYDHQALFNEGLGEVVTFLNDAIAQDYKERFQR